MIGHDQVWKNVAQECPRRIISALHSQGHYVHGRCSRFPNKVLCIHRDGTLPPDWTPTEAQLEAWKCQEQEELEAAAEHP